MKLFWLIYESHREVIKLYFGVTVRNYPISKQERAEEALILLLLLFFIKQEVKLLGLRAS